MNIMAVLHELVGDEWTCPCGWARVTRDAAGRPRAYALKYTVHTISCQACGRLIGVDGSLEGKGYTDGN